MVKYINLYKKITPEEVESIRVGLGLTSSIQKDTKYITTNYSSEGFSKISVSNNNIIIHKKHNGQKGYSESVIYLNVTIDAQKFYKFNRLDSAHYEAIDDPGGSIDLYEIDVDKILKKLDTRIDSLCNDKNWFIGGVGFTGNIHSFESELYYELIKYSELSIPGRSMKKEIDSANKKVTLYNKGMSLSLEFHRSDIFVETKVNGSLLQNHKQECNFADMRLQSFSNKFVRLEENVYKTYLILFTGAGDHYSFSEAEEKMCEFKISSDMRTKYLTILRGVKQCKGVENYLAKVGKDIKTVKRYIKNLRDRYDINVICLSKEMSRKKDAPKILPNLSKLQVVRLDALEEAKIKAESVFVIKDV